MKQLSTLVFILLSIQRLLAFGDRPRTLMNLINGSSSVVIAQVDNPDDTSEVLDFTWESTNRVAKLYLMDVLKGNLQRTDTIEVKYSTSGICGGSYYFYSDKEIAIFFLDNIDTSKQFTSGTPIVSDNKSQREYFKSTILDYVEISKIKNDENRDLATLEWLVKCSENIVTRNDAVIDLLLVYPESIYGSYYADPLRSLPRFKSLTQSQKKRLERVFFEGDTIEFYELGLINFVSKENYPILKQHLLRNLSLENNLMTYDLMRAIVYITPNPELEKIAEEYGEYQNYAIENPNRKILIDNFLKIASRE